MATSRFAAFDRGDGVKYHCEHAQKNRTYFTGERRVKVYRNCARIIVQIMVDAAVEGLKAAGAEVQIMRVAETLPEAVRKITTVNAVPHVERIGVESCPWLSPSC